MRSPDEIAADCERWVNEPNALVAPFRGLLREAAEALLHQAAIIHIEHSNNEGFLEWGSQEKSRANEAEAERDALIAALQELSRLQVIGSRDPVIRDLPSGVRQRIKEER